ncbi:MAG TPA: glycosyltransferase [Solirubrobacterales bacterium]|nr:glycosyltransferase [Solirubrobacterales bacterium]
MALEVNIAAPAASVVIPAFNARGLIGRALESLYAQDLDVPFEIIVVVSGTDDCADYLGEHHPSVRVHQSTAQLLPGPARNAGVRMAVGEVIAFASADTRAAPRWLAERLRLHLSGCDLVGGSILNGTPRSWIGTAGYLMEYSALLPVGALLRQQDVAHALSFKRSVFELVGEYPEDITTGEDTIFNQRCLAAGLRLGFAPQAGLYHDNTRDLSEFLRHAAAHGRGLAQCIERYELATSFSRADAWSARGRGAATFRYTTLALTAKYRRVARFAPRFLPALVACTPLIAAGSAVTAWSTLNELRS